MLVCLLALGVSTQRLQPDELPDGSVTAVGLTSRRRYGGEVRRDAKLWARMKATESAMRATTTLVAGMDAQSAIPKDFTWGNHDGINYLSSQRNQHAPVYCGSCWAFAATSTLSDRYNIFQKKHNPTQPFEPIHLSVQNILSCGNLATECGTCEGGDDAMVFMYASKDGIPDDNCSPYMAVDMECTTSLIGTNHTSGMMGRPHCYTCDEHKNCYTILKHNRLWTSEPYTVSGESAMQDEIHKHGPIACAILATPKLEHHYGSHCLAPPVQGNMVAKENAKCMLGTFQEPVSETDSRINHVVSVVGWGTDDKGNNYWLGRNSWGSEWAYGGYFKIVRSNKPGPLGDGNNLIETQCNAAQIHGFAEENPGQPNGTQARSDVIIF